MLTNSYSWEKSGNEFFIGKMAEDSYLEYIFLEEKILNFPRRLLFLEIYAKDINSFFFLKFLILTSKKGVINLDYLIS